MHTARLVLEKLSVGDPITDDELATALPFFESLARQLAVLGPVFQLAFVEANRIYMTLDRFAHARATS